MKLCLACGETKPLTEFYRRSDDTAGGYQSRCRTCQGVHRRRDPPESQTRVDRPLPEPRIPGPRCGRVRRIVHA